ncbi:MAG: hypothetical protein IPI58_02840 [Alphaproteobacteria bacterium]|nr:MAG: hypothetical protein IPI58_02840 [Alphaproteobacteria bacterium]
MSFRKIAPVATMALMMASAGTSYAAKEGSPGAPPMMPTPSAGAMEPGYAMTPEGMAKRHEAMKVEMEKRWQDQFSKLSAEQKKALSDVLDRFGKLDDNQKQMALMRITGPMARPHMGGHMGPPPMGGAHGGMTPQSGMPASGSMAPSVPSSPSK